MERTLRLVLAYDGAAFHGWQRQPGMRTVQEEVEAILRRVLRHPLALVGASRTDAGVHARGQTAHVVTRSPIPTRNLATALADRLPDDVAVVHVDETPAGFHAIRDARQKLYRYAVFASARAPAAELAQRQSWHVWHALDLGRLRAAAADLVGTHDFAGFAGAGCPRVHTVRTILRFEVRRRGRQILFDVAGTGFLYHQVRNMVGTLIEIGRGHWPVARIREILDQRDRRRAGPTAPPQGLCLRWVQYDACPAASNDHESPGGSVRQPAQTSQEQGDGS